MTGVGVKTVEKLMCSGFVRRVSDSSSALFTIMCRWADCPLFRPTLGYLIWCSNPSILFYGLVSAFCGGAQNGVGLCRTWAFPITPTSFALLIVVPESNQLSAGHSGPIFSSTHLFQGFLLAFSQKGLQCILDVQPYRKRYIVSWFHKIQNSLLPRLK